MKKQSAITSFLALTALAGSQAVAGGSFEGVTRDAWLSGKVETVFALNSHLNPFSIHTDVENGAVHLTGAVPTDIDRDLAGELAKGVEGVASVDNDLVVDATARQGAERDASSGRKRNFGSWVDDATTTAAVKTRLIGNGSTKGLQIDVDTRDDVVTLSGRVSTEEEKALAGEIARNSSDVADVHNDLVVDPK
jgi:hyperosmotically inducible protein